MRRQRYQRLLAGALAMLTVVSVLFWKPSDVFAEAGSDGEAETVLLEGITLNRSSLVMKTGEQKALLAALLPEDTSENPEIVWSTDDPAVAQVSGNGLEAVVTAPRGAGGTAVITVSAGGFTAACPVLVTVQDPMLESALFMQNSSGSNRYELRESAIGEQEYILRIPENTNVVYVRPQLRDDVTEEAKITAYFTDVYSGEEVSVDLPVDETTSLSSSTAGRLIRAYDTEPKELVIDVVYGEQKETYLFHIVRGSYLGDLKLTDEKGEPLAFTPDFKKNVFEYSVHVPSSQSQIQIHMTPAEESSTELTVNGEAAEGGNYTLPLAGAKVIAVLRAGDGVQSVPYEYVLTVYVDEICYLTVDTEPADAVFAVYDENKVQIDPVDGRYELIKGGTYTYTVSAQEYQTQNGSFVMEGDEEKSFSLEKISESQFEELDAEWGGYWKNADNQNITDAPTPSSLDNAEVRWKQQYGSNADYSNSVSDGILVENYICCFCGETLMYLDRATGEMIRSVKMAAKGNSSFNKPLYAAGMLFVPLNDGKVQAFNASTLESVWVYVDTVGGNAATALRYDSGYLYAGFADGNLVCISTADEEPEQAEEEKSAVWRKYDKGGYYRTGVYTGEKYLYACGRSGSLYCLDKKTGETVQKLALPAEAGAPTTAVSHSDGRIYFATEKGYLYSCGLAEDGKLDIENMTSLKLGGIIYGTPVVYQNRVYAGSAMTDSYGIVTAPYYLNVVQVGEEGGLSLSYRMEVKYCPKGTGTLSTAYEQQDGCVYLYFTTDSSNGSLYLLKDREGLTSPGEGSGLFYQQTEVFGNGSGSVLADSGGNLYFRYESAWMYSLKPTELYLTGVEASGERVVVDGGQPFDRQMEQHTVLLDSASDRVTLTFSANEGAVVSIDGREGNVQEVTLEEGMAEVQVVLSKNGQLRTYQFTIRRRGSDAFLERLQVSYSPMLTVMEMELQPSFQPEITEYNSSLYGNDDMKVYYIWPELSKGSAASMKVTVVEGVQGMQPGQELEPMTVQLDEPRQRYKVTPAGTDAAKVLITVTAEDGQSQRVYELSMFRNNEVPRVTAGAGALVSRQEHTAVIRVNASMDGYLYYLPDRKAGTAGMPTQYEIKTNGKRVAVSAGTNTVTLDGFETAESVVYLYEMGYNQRWSNGIQIEVPAYTGGQPTPDPPGRGDLNGDGNVDITDVVCLLDEVAKGSALPAEAADLNGDGHVDITDVVILLDEVAAGE
ncbi:cadherin-like beta sandwich domain-containing protein [Wansuia hejianensis]|uniref:Cadherin-like beta sandwich domain-containing protein n=1 Tax=Wansuia hejianensis TaxID=2763667 RepID=A0A7G9GF83_9FIRM|nr:cadherin-like beta sandwich domain-containing protein [Wansuia hejianensis]QNM09465.1 cadherin-like beta sandwich domain-containing protein [Wansuia hejianensis]